MIEKNVDIKPFVHFKIGPVVSFFCTVKTIDELKKAWIFAKENQLKVFVLGKGSNLLMNDTHFTGMVIRNQINDFKIENEDLFVGSGASFAHLGKVVSKKGLSGLEFASGIPGTVGGAIYMNAGANGQEIKDCLVSCQVLTNEGIIKTLTKKELKLAYRHSIFHHESHADMIILQGHFKLKKDPNAQKRQQDYLKKRMQTQPYDKKTAGCCFKNPSKDLSAGKLIEESGLKGFSINGASISKKHANFIINEKQATFEDVIKVIDHVQKKVKQEKGIDLELEMKVICDANFTQFKEKLDV